MIKVIKMTRENKIEGMIEGLTYQVLMFQIMVIVMFIGLCILIIRMS